MQNISTISRNKVRKLCIKTFAATMVCLPMVAQGLSATNRNSVDVSLQAKANDPATLLLFKNGSPIDVIDFPKNKKFIRFLFPEGYSNFDIRVFELNESAEKTRILSLYQADPAAGVEAYDAQWNGKASSQQKGHEFNLNAPSDKYMILRNLNKDGTIHGTLHDYIIKFTVNGITYLQDPQIRNKT